MKTTDEIEAIAILIADVKERQEEMEIEIVSLGERMQKAVSNLLSHPDITEQMREELLGLMAGMQLAIWQLQGKELH